MKSCEEQFTMFNNTIQGLLDTFLPIKSIKICHSDKPWVTTQYIELIQQGQQALLSGNFDRYKELRNKVNRMSKYLQSSYYHEKVQNLKKSEPQKWWSNINALMGRKTKCNAMQGLTNEFTDGKLKPLADLTNTTFQSSKELPKLTPTHQHPASIVPDDYVISVPEVEKKLMNIPWNKAVSPDNVPNWIYRDFAGHLSGPICAIFNSSMRDGYIPII